MKKTGKYAWLLISLWILMSGKIESACSFYSYYLSADILYWKPMHCPIFIAQRSNGINNTPNPRDELYLTGEFNPGVRARLGYQKCKWYFDISYLYFRSRDDKEEAIDDFAFMQIVGGRPRGQGVSMAKSFATFLYQNVDGRFGYHFCFDRDLTFFLYGNVRWIKIDFKNSTQGRSINDPTFFNSFKQDSHFKGGGFGLGAKGEYCLCRGFSLLGNIGVLAIIGESQLKNYSSSSIVNNTTRLNFLDRPENWTHILPGVSFCLGINYLFYWHNKSIQAEVGYELDYYSEVIRYASDNLLPLFGSAEIPLFSCQDIGFGGPYFNVCLKF